MKIITSFLCVVVFSLVHIANAAGQTTTEKPASGAGQVVEQYRQRTQQNVGNMQQQIYDGLNTMRQTVQQAQVTYDGRVIVANDTIDIVTPMQGMAEGLLKAAEGMDMSPNDLGGVRTAISTMPFLLKGGLDMLKTVLPTSENEEKK